MNKKSLIFLFSAIMLTASSVMAETSIYTDGIGRMHFLGKDPGSSPAGQTFHNPMQRDLTRRLYDETSNEIRYVDHPLKDYENTFSDSRFTTTKAWKQRFTNNTREEKNVNVKETTKGSFSAEKGTIDTSYPYAYGSTQIDNADKKSNNKKTK